MDICLGRSPSLDLLYSRTVSLRRKVVECQNLAGLFLYAFSAYRRLGGGSSLAPSHNGTVSRRAEVVVCQNVGYTYLYFFSTLFCECVIASARFSLAISSASRHEDLSSSSMSPCLPLRRSSRNEISSLQCSTAS